MIKKTAILISLFGLMIILTGCMEVNLRLVTTVPAPNRYYENALKENDKNIHAYFENGKIYMKEKDYKNAEKNFNKAVEINPNFAEAYIGLGNTYYLAENYDKAQAAFKKSMELSPGNIDSYEGMAKCYLKNNQNEKAFEILSDGLKKGDATYSAAELMGDIYYIRMDYEKTVQYWEKSLSLFNGNKELSERYNSLKAYLLEYKSK